MKEMNERKMYRLVIKRILDILFAIILLPFILLLFLILFPIVKLNSKGPFFYKSERIGKNEKKYKMYKIRTMKVDALDIRNKDGSTFNSDKDPRVTRVGNFLRKSSLDELPQIFNVLNGSMSFIGPRPDLYSQLGLYDEKGYNKSKFKVKPGISGYAQVKGRNILDWKEKNELDVYYAEKCSFWLDTKIFFLTIFAIFKRKGINKNV